MNTCTGCHACEVWCRRENNLPKTIWRIRVTVLDPSSSVVTFEPENKEIDKRWGVPQKLFVPQNCYHCGRAPCIESCPKGAIERRADGIVHIVADKCIGCKQCILVCPYGAIQFNDKIGIADKCNMCAHLVDRGQVPVCVSKCPYKARKFGTLDELSTYIEKEKIKVLVIPELEWFQPAAFYCKGGHKF
ncbi:MAG: 4Fe-4S dicluster domain-containing protein [Euryarchaeota archaeon]|nr:4Fe-4S dicluster domain-containing protein [Euryarchaeota archaeon]